MPTDDTWNVHTIITKFKVNIDLAMEIITVCGELQATPYTQNNQSCHDRYFVIELSFHRVYLLYSFGNRIIKLIVNAHGGQWFTH